MSRAVCVYCGSSLGARPEYAEVARRVGTALGAARSAWSTAAGGPG